MPAGMCYMLYVLSESTDAASLANLLVYSMSVIFLKALNVSFDSVTQLLACTTVENVFGFITNQQNTGIEWAE